MLVGINKEAQYLQMVSVGDYVPYLNDVLNHCVDLFVPLGVHETIRVLSASTRRLRRRVKSLYKKYISSDKDERARLDSSKELKTYRNGVLDDVLKNKLKILKSGSKSRFWNYCRSRSVKGRNVVPCSLNGVGGNQIDSEAEIAEEFNRYFNSVFINDNGE